MDGLSWAAAHEHVLRRSMASLAAHRVRRLRPSHGLHLGGGPMDGMRVALSSAAAHGQFPRHRLAPIVSASSSSELHRESENHTDGLKLASSAAHHRPPPPFTCTSSGPDSSEDDGEWEAAEQEQILASLLCGRPRPFSAAAAARKLPLPRGSGGGWRRAARTMKVAPPPPLRSCKMREMRRRQRRKIEEQVGDNAAEGTMGKEDKRRNKEPHHDIQAAATVEGMVGAQKSRNFEEYGAASAASLALDHTLAGRLPLAVHYASLAARSGLPPQDQHRLCAHIIRLASRLHRHDVVLDFLAQMGASPRLFLSLRQCTAVMSACRKLGAHDTVQVLFQWWKSSGFRPNPFMYEIVITSLSAMGKHRDALGVYWEMEESGCSPDLLAYIALMEACAELGDSCKALMLFSRLKDQGISAHPRIYFCLVEACIKDGRLSRARQFSLEAERMLIDISSAAAASPQQRIVIPGS